LFSTILRQPCLRGAEYATDIPVASHTPIYKTYWIMPYSKSGPSWSISKVWFPLVPREQRHLERGEKSRRGRKLIVTQCVLKTQQNEHINWKITFQLTMSVKMMIYHTASLTIYF
jgi:hypothetical protein